MHKKVLVTGGSGFLGINMISYLLRQGITDITALDLAELSHPVKKKITAVTGDIRSADTVREVMKDVNWVIHTAAALPLNTEEEIFTTNVLGTRALLFAAQKENVERFVHLSSTTVYGIPDQTPVSENAALTGDDHYSKTKIEAEKVCLEYRSKGMCVPILRPKSCVGPERLGVFSLFYDWAKAGKNFPMIGNGNNRCQLLDVEDLCEAIYLCLTKDKNLVNDVFNVGAKEFTTMKEDFQAVLDRACFNKKVVETPAALSVALLGILETLHLSPIYKSAYETARVESIVSTEKIEKMLDFHPRFSNKQALIRNYGWYLSNLNAFEGKSGFSNRTPCNQGALKFIKSFF